MTNSDEIKKGETMQELKAEANNRRQPSPWVFVSASALLAFLSLYMLGLYSTVHWPLLSSCVGIERNLTELDLIALKHIPSSSEDAEKWRTLTEEMRKLTTRMEEASGSLLMRTEVYRLLGLASFIASVLAFARRPRWVGFVALSFGLVGLILAAITM
jgi:hypothetical protein